MLLSSDKKCLAYLLLVCFVVLSTFYVLQGNRRLSTKTIQNHDDEKLSSFYETWCKVRRYMKDWRRIKQGCDGLLEWGSAKRGWDERTDAGRSIVIAMDIRRTCKWP